MDGYAAEIIERETKSNCVFKFAKSYVKECEFTAYGTCSECQGKVTVKSSNGRHTFCIDMKKGPLPQELFTKSMNDVFLNQAKEIPIDAENVPRNFVSKKSIENIKAKKNRSDDSAINVLRQMKYSPDFNGSIKELASDPFFVLFWTTKQRFYFAEIKKKIWG